MQDIYQAIPHRPPFLFIDEIVEIKENSALCRRTLRAEEFFFEGHYPGNPITPGVLLCESVFQCGAIFLVKKWERENAPSPQGKTPVLSRIQDARFKRMVKPGDTVEIEAIFQKEVHGFQFMRGVVRKDGKVALQVEFVLALLDESVVAEG